ncbi:hypothetical protein EDB85DRAFT_2033957, partial [Lactarius pseudohatsudake]
MLAAKQALLVPILISHFCLCSYVVLVVSKHKGITLVFKTDPLQNVDINSTFDSIAVIQSFIQCEIEGLLRQMFREDLPGITHRLSQLFGSIYCGDHPVQDPPFGVSCLYAVPGRHIPRDRELRPYLWLAARETSHQVRLPFVRTFLCESRSWTRRSRRGKHRRGRGRR